jgi:hypothetical protein
VKLFFQTIYVVSWFFVSILSASDVQAQKQLLLLKGERVKLRLNPGDDIVYRLKNSKTIRRSYVNNLTETTLFTHSDTVPFHTIDRIYFRQPRFYNKVGSRLFAGGIVLFVFDQVNNSWIHNKETSLDGDVTIVSVALVATGLPLMLIRKKSQRLNYKFRLIMVEKGSIFYKPDMRGL